MYSVALAAGTAVASVLPMGMPKPPLSWRVLDLLKVHSSPRKSRSSPLANISAQARDVHKCSCCGLVVAFHEGSTKFRCSQCNATNMMVDFDDLELHPPNPPISFASVKALADKCLAGPRAKNSHELHVKLQPLVDYLCAAFGSIAIINSSFQLGRPLSRARYLTSNLDLVEFRKTFELLARLPSRKPLYSALCATQYAIKRLPLHMTGNPKNLYWAVLLIEIPFLHKALTISDNRPYTHSSSIVEMPKIRSLCYDILKRVLGILSQTESSASGNYLASWFLKLDKEEFVLKINLINLYITFHLKRCFYYTNNPKLARRASLGELFQSGKTIENSLTMPARKVTQSHEDEYERLSYLKDDIDDSSENPPSWPHLRLSSGANGKANTNGMKIRTFNYTQNYHLRTATAVLGIFVKANYIRNEREKVPVYVFYNSLVDYVNIKLDFDGWLSKKRAPECAATNEPSVRAVIEYIKGNSSVVAIADLPKTDGFFFCQYPYLISLGGKISILQYEARRQMERKAEEAFITSLDKRIMMDVYFKVRVRRENIVQDSLQCIRQNQGNLKKGIKVQFLNEPGIDAGGLKKEWFLLLTRALFSPATGMLHEVEDSNFLWFKVIPLNNLEVCYLFGAVLGLAIYNSTILDLSFPLALYKILLGNSIGLAEYKEIFPVSAANLFKLRDYLAEELAAMDLTFEVSFQDLFGGTFERDLIENGSNVAVTIENRETYIEKYAHFFVSDGIRAQVLMFKKGFSSIVDGNAFSLFLPEEIQLLLCGSDHGRIDVNVLRSVTHYTGWKSKEDAVNSRVVNWFWDYLNRASVEEQKRVLQFITGSDRIPATGIENLSLNLNRQNNGKDSDRLPVAHTCFNELILYEYSTEEKFTEKFTQAVTMLSGFGIK